MNFMADWPLDQIHEPIDHVILDKCWDDCLLDAALLQQGQTEPLQNRTVLLLF